MLKLHLLIIDPQNDFCDPKGALSVQGALDDMKRLSDMIKRIGNKIFDIHVTLDTHHYLDIAHPSFWVSGNDYTLHPNPFTIITPDDVDKNVWRAKTPAHQKRAKEYVHKLALNNRYLLCIWPPHCLIGSWGHGVIQPLYDTLLEWEKKYGWVDYVTKGSNMYTEHYSAVKADVFDPEDPSTDINKRLVDILQDGDMVVIAGEAKSHCVANTVRDIAAEFGDIHTKKIILLEDAMSNVPGFEKLGEDFFSDMRSMGVTITKTTQLLP